jgi:hypothetical protein
LPEVPISWVIFVLLLGVVFMRATGRMDRDRFLEALGVLVGGQQLNIAVESRRRRNGNGREG